MTITNTLDHVNGATTESVLVEISEQSSAVLVNSDVDPKTGEHSSVYALPTGDPLYPATLTYRSGFNNPSEKKYRRISMTLSTWARTADSVLSTEIVAPITGTISMNLPQNVQLDIADIDDLLGNMFHLMFPSQSAGVRSTTYLSKLLFGVSQVL